MSVPAVGELDLDLSKLNAHIVAELAMGLSDAAAIRKRYEISDERWHMLAANPVFRAMLVEAIKTFSGDMNAGLRITKKAEVILEDSLPAYDALIHNPETPAASKIEAGKFLAGLTGRNKEGSAPAPGSGFTLNINIGNGKERLTIDAPPLPALPHE